MGSTDVPLTSPTTSRSGLVDFGASLRLWDSTYTAFTNSGAFASLARLCQAYSYDGTVNWGKVVFLTTCFITMLGCGVISSVLRRKAWGQVSGKARFRRTRKGLSKRSEGMVTSSDEEDYDSTGSLRHGIEGTVAEKTEVPQQKQSENGWYSLSVSMLDTDIDKPMIQTQAS